MGILLTVIEVAVITIDAVTEAAAAAAAITSVVSEETAVIGEIAVEEAAEGAAGAVEVAEVEGPAELITQRCILYIEKFTEKIKEFCYIDNVFKAAKKLLHNEKCERMNKSLDILHKLQCKMTDVSSWLKEHKDDTVVLEGFQVSLDAALLKKVLNPLSVALGSLKRLTDEVSKLNTNNQVISDAMILSFERSLIRIVATFHQFAAFKEEKSDTIHELKSFPITTEEVNEWKDELGFVYDEGLSVLNSERYKYPENVCQKQN